jgi:hypothetical protein
LHYGTTELVFWATDDAGQPGQAAAGLPHTGAWNAALFTAADPSANNRCIAL